MVTHIKENICPLCGKPNRCNEKGVVKGITMEKCWCAYETFPNKLLAQVPAEKQRKACICINCLHQFKKT